MENINNFVYRDKTNTAIKMYTGIFFVLSLFLKNYTSKYFCVYFQLLAMSFPSLNESREDTLKISKKIAQSIFEILNHYHFLNLKIKII